MGTADDPAIEIGRVWDDVSGLLHCRLPVGWVYVTERLPFRFIGGNGQGVERPLASMAGADRRCSCVEVGYAPSHPGWVVDDNISRHQRIDVVHGRGGTAANSSAIAIPLNALQ